MADNSPNIELPVNEWVDLYSLSGISVGTAVFVENIGICDVYVAVQATKPDTDHESYNVVQRDNGVRVKNTVGDSGAWAFCNSRGGKITVGAVDEQGFYPPLEKRRFVDGNGNELFLERNGAVPVNVQDQTTRAIVLPMVEQLGATTNSVAIVGDGLIRTLTVTDPTGIVAGQHMRVIDSTDDHFWSGGVLGIVGSVVTVDTPFDAGITYPIGSQVTFSNANLAIVDGSTTPVVFKLRTGAPSIPSLIDITRIIITCTTESAVDLDKFGDLPALAVGLIFRLATADPYTMGNAKTNKDLANFAYDFTPWVASNPGQGIHGFVMRMTFAGQNKIGVALRVGPTENLELVVQDDLTGLLTFVAIIEGHVVTD